MSASMPASRFRPEVSFQSYIEFTGPHTAISFPEPAITRGGYEIAFGTRVNRKTNNRSSTSGYCMHSIT